MKKTFDNLHKNSNSKFKFNVSYKTFDNLQVETEPHPESFFKIHNSIVNVLKFEVLINSSLQISEISAILFF